MTVKFDLKNHIALTSAKEIEQICEPLKKFGITYFTYFKTFNDGSHIRLSNHGPWTEHYYNREFYNVIIQQVPTVNGFILWSCLDAYPIFQEAEEYFNVSNGVVLVVRSGDIVERYFFGSTKDNEVIKRFFSFNVDSLNRFVLYFKDKAYDLIQEATTSRIFSSHTGLIINPDEDVNKDENVNAFFEATKIEKYCVMIDGAEFCFPEREAQVLAMMKKGWTSKEMAKKLDVLPRTIDSHRIRLKERLQEGPNPRTLKQAMKCHLIDTGNLFFDTDLPDLFKHSSK